MHRSIRVEGDGVPPAGHTGSLDSEVNGRGSDPPLPKATELGAATELLEDLLHPLQLVGLLAGNRQAKVTVRKDARTRGA